MSRTASAPFADSPGSSSIPTLVVLAAGLSTRFGAVKPLASVGPHDVALIDYALFDAARSGYGGALLVVRREIERDVARHVRALTGGSWPCRTVCQRADDLPPGSVGAPGREKPWGTGHAVWVARNHLVGPFVVVNADDFYGRAALESAGEGVRSLRSNEGLAVTYRLSDTLATTGAVSRAVLEVDVDGWVSRIREVLRVRRSGGDLVGETPDGTTLSLSGEEPVSMGLWGFMPGVFSLLEARFRALLAAPGRREGAEFYLSDTLNELVVSGGARVRAVASGGPSFGVTFPADVARVRSRVERLVADHQYPADLSGAFRALSERARVPGSET